MVAGLVLGDGCTGLGMVRGVSGMSIFSKGGWGALQDNFLMREGINHWG